MQLTQIVMKMNQTLKKKRERVCYPELKNLNDSFDVIDPDSKEDFTDEPNTEKKNLNEYIIQN